MSNFWRFLAGAAAWLLVFGTVSSSLFAKADSLDPPRVQVCDDDDDDPPDDGE